MLNPAKHRLAFFFGALFFIIITTTITVWISRGYRPDLKNKTLKPTGILALNSSPAGASIYVNGKLKSATNDAFSLEPGIYQIQIKKEGFFDWEKTLQVKKELVTFAEAYLFPKVPDLKPLTFNGVSNPKISPDNSKILYSIPLSNPEAGLWIIDLNESLLGLSKPPKLIAKSRPAYDFAKADYFWSPDSRQIIVQFPENKKTYLFDSNQLNEPSPQNDITLTLDSLIEEWQQQENLKLKQKLSKLPLPLQEIILSQSASFAFSPDSTKILYQATASAKIPENLTPGIINASTQKEHRQLEPGKFYAYDLKEDKNFLIPFNQPQLSPSPKPSTKTQKTTPTPTPPPLPEFDLNSPKWFPTSQHLVWIKENKVYACEYDGTNLTPIYSGPFIKPYVFLASKPDRLIILNETVFELPSAQESPTPTLNKANKTKNLTPTPTPPLPNLYAVYFR